jgi:hypothetical protein
MTIQHKLIPDSDLHEPKGVATAAAKSVYVATGAATGVWTLSANGAIYFDNISVPYSLTYPATYTKLSPTTLAIGIGNSVTEATTARLTSVKAGTSVFRAEAQLSVSQASGANKALRFGLYKNGALIPGSVITLTTVTALIYNVTLSIPVSLAENDYVEVYAQNDGASGDIAVYTFNLQLVAQEN